MPKSRPYRRKAKRFRKRRNKVSTIVNVPGNRGGVTFRNPARLVYANLGYLFPTFLKIRLPYFDYAQIATSAGTNYAEFILRANSIYDPMVSGFTRDAQSPARDALTTFYGAYKVTKSFVNVNFRSTSASCHGKICIHANTTSTGDTTTYADNPYQLFSQPNTKVAYFNTISAGDPPTQLMMSRTSKAMMPFNGPDASAAGLYTGNPVASWYYHITVWDQENDTTSGVIDGSIDVKMVQDVLFGNLREVTDA